MEVDSWYRLKLTKTHESLIGLFDLDVLLVVLGMRVVFQWNWPLWWFLKIKHGVDWFTIPQIGHRRSLFLFYAWITLEDRQWSIFNSGCHGEAWNWHKRVAAPSRCKIHIALSFIPSSSKGTAPLLNSRRGVESVSQTRWWVLFPKKIYRLYIDIYRQHRA